MLKFGFQNAKARELVEVYDLRILEAPTKFKKIISWGNNRKLRINVDKIKARNLNLLNPYQETIKDLAIVAAMCYEYIDNDIITIPKYVLPKNNGGLVVYTMDCNRTLPIESYRKIANLCELKNEQLARLEKILKELD